METGKKSKRKAVIVAIVVLLLVVIAVLGFVIYSLLNKEEEPESRMPSEGLVVDATEENDYDLGLFTTDMNMVWNFPKGKLTSNDAIIGNSIENKYDAYFEIYLEDEEETLLYTSPILPVGKRIDKLKLDKGLPAGRHEALCTFHMVAPDDQEKVIGDVSFYVTLVFE